MNYHFEVFLYWLLAVSFIAFICFKGGILMKKHLPKKWYSQYENSGYLNDGIEDQINNATGVIFMGLVAFVTIAPIYPTPLSVPTVEITAQGEIKALPFGAWIWDVPNDNTYVRLKKSWNCNLMYLRGRTSDGVQVTIDTTLMGTSLLFRLTDPTVFYGYYKTGGVGSFCAELRAVEFSELFSGKTIYPESDATQEDIEKKQRALKNHLKEVFKETLSGRGVVSVAEE